MSKEFKPTVELIWEFLKWINPNQIDNFLESTKPTPLFTGEDGKEIFKGDRYWFVDRNYFIYNRVSISGGAGSHECFKYFSTQEAAEAYVMENKPQFSLKDIERAYRKAGPLFSPLYYKFINELKSKLNNK